MRDDLSQGLLSHLIDIRAAVTMDQLREILGSVDEDLLARLVEHCSRRQQHRKQMADLLRAIPRRRLASLGADRVSQLYRAFL